MISCWIRGFTPKKTDFFSMVNLNMGSKINVGYSLVFWGYILNGWVIFNWICWILYILEYPRQGQETEYPWEGHPWDGARCLCTWILPNFIINQIPNPPNSNPCNTRWHHQPFEEPANAARICILQRKEMATYRFWHHVLLKKGKKNKRKEKQENYF